jgi:hypothetical protein
MIGARQLVFLNSSQGKRGAAVRAMIFEYVRRPGAVAPDDEMFSEALHVQRPIPQLG